MRSPQLQSAGWVARDPQVAGRLAALYDLDNEAKDDDLPFFREMARRTGGPILELACGTGRLAVPLARDGHRVVGLDISEAQLERARARAAQAGTPVDLVLGDMRDFALPEPFRLIFIAFNSFLYLGSEERTACLARVREHLAPDGVFLIDVFQPQPETIVGLQHAMVHLWTREDPETGRIVMKSHSSEADVDGVEVTHIYDELDADGCVRRYLRSFRLHYMYRQEASLTLRSAGFQVEAMYGSYELEPAGPGSPKLLIVARRRERAVAERRRG